MKIYKYDNDKMMMTEIPMAKFAMAGMLSIILIILISFTMGFYFRGEFNSKLLVKLNKNNPTSKYDENPELLSAWKDSVFKDYKLRADLYLNRPIFKGTPLNGDILSLCAINAYDSTGILLPVELALSQAQWESGMGREGKSPIKNPYNIGEHDSGTVKWFESTFDGVQAYYYFMCNNYLRCKSIDELFYNFTDCGGHRYASGEQYEEKVRSLYYSIKKWIDSNIKN